jgi:hypothetical protein
MLGKEQLKCDMDKKHDIIKKAAFLLFLFMNTSIVNAQSLNDYLLDRLTASWQCRQVDYEEMIDVVLNKKDSLDSYLRGLAFIEIMRSEGNDSMTIKMIDKLFDLYDDSRIAGMRNYLLDTKVRLLILNNRYAEVGKTADYVAKRWPQDSDMQQWAIRHKRLAEAAKDVKPVIVKWEKDETRLVANKNLTYQNESLPFMTFNAKFNGVESNKLFMDTGLMTSMNIMRSFADKIGVKLLPDTLQMQSANQYGKVFNLQLGILDSFQLGNVTIYNHPVYVSDEEEQYGNVGVIGTPDLARFGYVEITKDSLILRKHSGHKEVEPNFTMNPGIKGTKCICLPCICQGRQSKFVLDTGSNSFLIPEGDNTSEIVAEVGGQTLEIAAGMYSHPLVLEHDAIGFWGLPILWALDRILLDFEHRHVDFIKKKGVSNTLRLASDFQL